MKMSKKYIKASVMTSIVLLIVGLLLIFKSEMTISLISYIIGTILIIVGVMALLKYFKNIKDHIQEYDLNIIYGIVCIILGSLVIKNKETIASIIPFILGISIIINGTSKLQYTLELRKIKNYQWKISLLASIISVACGIILIFNPFKGAVMITKIIGIFVSIYSILDIVSTLAIKYNIGKTKNDIQEAIIEEIDK